jgi:hypothetical protein
MDEGRLLLNLSAAPCEAALRLSDRSIRGLRGRRPFARDARSRPLTRQRHGIHHWLGRPNWRYRLECDQTAARMVSDPAYPARRLALQMRRRKSPPSTGPWRITVSFSHLLCATRNDQIRGGLGLLCTDRLVKTIRDRYTGKMNIMPYSYDDHGYFV